MKCESRCLFYERRSKLYYDITSRCVHLRPLVTDGWKIPADVVALLSAPGTRTATAAVVEQLKHRVVRRHVALSCLVSAFS